MKGPAQSIPVALNEGEGLTLASGNICEAMAQVCLLAGDGRHGRLDPLLGHISTVRGVKHP